MIEFKNISKEFPDGTKALQNVSFKINEGELLTLIGPSGCGKTTTMKMINRLIQPTEGEIFIHDEQIDSFNINELRWNIGYVLQEIALFPHLTIAENIAVVPEMKKWKSHKIKARTNELLEMVNLDPDTYAHKMPDELSGGQQQRIGVIRALAADPDIILMDEPFSALDPISREQLQEDIQSLQKQIQKTIVFVTHDINEALALGDRVCLMNDGEIVQIDTPQQLIIHPKNDFVKSFIGTHRSPWLTAVDVIGHLDHEHVLDLSDLHIAHDNPEQTFVVMNNDGKYEGTLFGGKQVEVEPIANNLQLYKAAKLLDDSHVNVLPITKGDQLVGILTNEMIVQFLRQEISIKNGVVQS